MIKLKPERSFIDLLSTNDQTRIKCEVHWKNRDVVFIFHTSPACVMLVEGTALHILFKIIILTLAMTDQKLCQLI